MRRFYRISNYNQNHGRRDPVFDLDSYRSNDSGQNLDDKEFSTLSTMQGVRLGKIPNEIKLTVNCNVNRKLELDFIPNGIGWHIFNDKLTHDILNFVGDDVEALPVDIYGDSGSLCSDFFVLNVLKVIPALSESKTIRARSAICGKRPILTVAVRRDAIPLESHIFRIKEWIYPVIIDDLLKAIIDKYNGPSCSPVTVE